MQYKISSILLVLILFSNMSFSQIGIGNTNPDASSILDITSTTQGLLTPRMTTLQRNDISSPANGLLVFDIDEGSFFYYSNSSWSPLEGTIQRDNYKLVKSVADLADELVAGGGSKYLLNPNYLYEINGEITLDFSIELNNSYLIGLDTNEDKLIYSAGDIFTGTTGGSIRNLSLEAGGNIFGIMGTGSETLVFQNSIVTSSGSIGDINNFALVFFNIIQFAGNTDGIVFTDINSLLLSNLGWFMDNTGTFETYVGTFNVIEKNSGFSSVPTGSIGIDVSSNPVINTSASISQVSFSGDGDRINGYTAGSYIGYDFTNDWYVQSQGISLETDDAATGDINLSTTVGSGFQTTFTGTGTSSRIKLAGTTTSTNLFRFTSSGDNLITYDGIKSRYFQINASLSFQGDTNNSIFIFYIAKNGIVEENTKVYREVGENNDVGALAIVGSLFLDPGDYLEVWAERFSGGGDVLTVSLNLIAN